MIRNFPSRRTRSLYGLLLIFLCGCSLFLSPEKIAEQKKRIEDKKTKYKRLYHFVTSGAIESGIAAEEIEELYGEPDDIYRSGSSVSQLQIWTYEKITGPREEEKWENIRLYFENGHLISWKY